MMENNKNNHDTFTVTGTNIDAVKRQNERSGMSYNEVKELLAKPQEDMVQESIVTPMLRKLKGKINHPWKKNKESHKVDFAGKMTTNRSTV